MARLKNLKWNLNCNETDMHFSIDHIKIALLMDLRDELQQLNRVFACQNFQSIPRILRGIQRKLPTPRHRKRAAKVKS